VLAPHDGEDGSVAGEVSTDVAPDTSDVSAEAKYKLSLKVDIESNGPCRKHVRVVVPREDIDHFRGKAIKDVSESAAVPGFRVGKVPDKLVERRFKKEIVDQVRQQVLLTSLEQLADDHKLDPINEPNFDVESLVLPDDGDFEYEFDIEVRPDFELPNYTGLKIRRPVKDITDADIDAYQEKFLAPYGALTDTQQPAQSGDFVEADFAFTRQGARVRELSDLTVQLRPRLQFPDGQIEGFDRLLTGATPGTTVSTQVTISSEAESVEMRGESIDVSITVSRVKRLELPELNAAFLGRFEMDTIDDLRAQIRNMLSRQVSFEQRQAARRQVLEKITESATWDLPEQLVRKQVENALRREILEMQQSGFTTEQIQARQNELRQKSISTTRQALKEHFVLDKIATKEDIQVQSSELDSEIYMMALQQGENPRRVRARLTKTGLIENLEAQVRERKAIDLILKSATYEDVPMPETDDSTVHAVSEAICQSALPTTSMSGDMSDE
jgi:trigger factor